MQCSSQATNAGAKMRISDFLDSMYNARWSEDQSFSHSADCYMTSAEHTASRKEAATVLELEITFTNL